MVGSHSDGIDSHIQALRNWQENLSELLNINELDYASDDEIPTKVSKEVEFNKLRCLALFLVANISFINSVVDSDIFKALCISFFYKNYHLPHEPIFIFTYLIETFKLSLEYLDPFPTPLKRGEYLFKLLRALKTRKATYDVITMIFVCISRNYGICSRIVSKYPADLVLGIFQHPNLFLDSSKQQRVWCEFFDTKDRLWKYIDFSTPKFDKDLYKYNESSMYLENLSKRNEEDNDSSSVPGIKDELAVDKSVSLEDRDIEVAMEFNKLYKNYLYIHRNDKLFIYRNSYKPEVSTIVVFPKYSYRVSRMLFVNEYPFESSRRIEKLRESFLEQSNNALKQRKLFKNFSKNIFILSCNIGGIVSEVTSKYVQKDLSYSRSSGFIEWFNHSLADLNHRRIQAHLCENPENKDPKLNKDVQSGGLEILNANLLESVDSKFINNLISSFPIPTKKSHFLNHSIYILKSQIKRNYVLKNNSIPVTSFGDDLVYLKADLEEVRTKFGWYKENRQVKADSNPVLIRASSNNKKSEYYTKDQTEPLKQDDIDELDRFTVNLSGKRYVPENSVYIRTKHYLNLEKICHRNKIFFKRAYSSLHYEDGSLKPKIDGVLIVSNQLERFLNLYDEHFEYAIHQQLNEERVKTCKFWKSVFKTLLNSPPINKLESTTSLRKNIDKHTSKFLNQLI